MRRSEDFRAVTNVTLAAVSAEPKPRAHRQPKRKESNHSFQEASMIYAKRLVALAALLATHVCAPAQASDYEVGKSLVCDTQGQVERFVDLFAGDASAAIRVVNAEAHNPSACAIANVAYMRGGSIGMARHGDNAFEIVRILVIGIATEGGVRPISPGAYFTLFSVKEYAI
jgi:hypothetical protein